MTSDTTMGRGRTTPCMLWAALSKVTPKTCHTRQAPSICTLRLTGWTRTRLYCRAYCRFWGWIWHLTRSGSIPVLWWISQAFTHGDRLETLAVHRCEYIIREIENNLLVDIMLDLEKSVDRGVSTKRFLVPYILWGLDLIRLGVKVSLCIKIEICISLSALFLQVCSRNWHIIWYPRFFNLSWQIASHAEYGGLLFR